MTLSLPPELKVPKTLIVDGDCSAQIGTMLSLDAVQSVLLIGDDTMEKLGVLAQLRDAAEASGARIHQSIVPGNAEPSDISIAPLIEDIKSQGVDAIVAVGGGTVIDSAKAAALLSVHGGCVADYKVPFLVEDGGLPVYAVPTTAGTGSEVTSFTVITVEASGEKLLLSGPGLMPAAALVDYRLSMTMPKRITADTGLDALTHAIESRVSKKASAASSAVALRAIEMIHAQIRTAYTDGDSNSARAAMMEAATLAGIAFCNASVALVHGMSRPIGAQFHVPHGLSNAMLLPSVTAFSLQAASHEYAECAIAMGVANEPDSDADANNALILALQQLLADLSVPSLEEFGIERGEFMDAIPTMAVQALESGSPANNPRVPSVDEIANLYALIYDRAPIEAVLAL